MAKNKVGIFNLALSAVGTRAKVSIDTENSREAEICNLWYEVVRDQVLRAADWSSARKTAVLALEAQRDFSLDWADGDPEPNWAYRYALPTDYLYPRYLESFSPFMIADQNSHPVLLTNEPNAVFVYTKAQDVPPAWDASLYMAIANALGAHIAMPLHGKAQRASLALQQANEAIVNARVSAANEKQVGYESIPDWLLARGATVGTLPSAFIYQNGPLLSMNTAFP